jgi:hypothetical protein
VAQNPAAARTAAHRPDPLDRFAVDCVEDLRCGDLAHVVARLPGDAGGVRAHQHVLELQQRVVARRRLGRPDVEAGAGDAAALEGFGKRRFVMNVAARSADEIGAVAHQRELCGAEHSAGLCRQRAID